MNLGQIFQQVSENFARKRCSGFSFSKLFANDLSKGDLICLLV